jgi:hypothetical protein
MAHSNSDFFFLGGGTGAFHQGEKGIMRIRACGAGWVRDLRGRGRLEANNYRGA